MTPNAETEPAPLITKECYRCTKPIRLTVEEYRADLGNHYTVCRICRAKLGAEASVIDSLAVLPLPAGAHTPLAF